MKALKISAIVLGGLAVVLAIVAVLAFTPGVQTWAVRKAAAGQPGLTLQVGRVAAGLRHAEITDLHVVQDGAVIDAKKITADYSAWDYLTGRGINVDALDIPEITIDLRKASPAAEKPGSPNPMPPVPGLLQQVELPFDLRVAKVAVKGRALLPDDQSATFSLQGGNVQTGQTGKLDLKAEFADARPAAPLQTLRADGTVELRLAADRRLDHVALDLTATAEGPKLPPDRVKLTAQATRAGADEDLAFSVSLLRGSTAEPLLKSAARYAAASREIAGTWDISIQSEQLAALLSGLGLPEVAASGTGKYTLNPATQAVAANGRLDARLSRLEKISPELAGIGALQVRTEFDGAFSDRIARLDRLQLEALTADGQRLAQLAATQRVSFNTADQRVTLANPQSELARVTIQSLPLAWAQPFLPDLTIDGGDLSLVLAVEADVDGSHVRARALEPLAIRGLTVRRGQQALAEQVSLSARPRADYSAAKTVAELAELNVSTPAGDSLTGNLGAEMASQGSRQTVAFNAQLQAHVVAALKPFLPMDPGPLTATVSANGGLEGQTLRLAKLAVAASRDQGPQLLSLELQQAVTADLETKAVAAADPQQPVARLRLGEVPLALAQPFVPNSQFAGAIAGGVFDVVARAADDLTLATAEPFAARGISVALDGKPLLQAVDFTAELTATKRGENIAYDVRRLELKQGNGLLAGVRVAGEAKLADKLALTAKGTLEADLALLASQPVAAGAAALSRGKVTSEFNATVGETIQAEAKLAARGLVAKAENRTLGDLDVALTASLREDGSGSVKAPLTLANAQRRSDVAVEATFSKAGEIWQLDGRVLSNQLFVDDFMPLAGLVPADEKPARPATRTPAPTPPPTRDTKPFWAGARGKLELDLKSVVYGKDYPIRAIRGSATIADNRLALDTLEGRLKETPFQASGSVAFNPQQAKPYTLAGEANVQNFDVGEFLRAANPDEKPAIESKMNVVAHLNGTGATLAELGKGVYGKFDLTGSEGVLRALGKKTEIASAGSALLGLAGALTNSNQTVAIAEVAHALAELRFDTFKMQVERGADLSFKLSNIEFISSLMRTTGSGRIVNQGTGDVQNQPMEILLQFGAKDQLAQLLSKAGLLGGESDDKGYHLLQRSFTIGGTPAKPDSSVLWKTLLSQATARAVPALQDLFKGR